MLVVSSLANAAIVDSVDNFQDGSTQGWSHGPPSPIPPTNVEDEGPLGSGDHVLQVMSTGDPGVAGGRFAFFNRTGKWTGDYIAAGLDTISADVNNLDTSETLYLRIGIQSTVGRYYSDSFTIGADSGWTPLSWSIDPADLTKVFGADASVGLMSVTELRFISSQAGSFLGDETVGDIFVDNIIGTSTTAVPEPAGTTVLALALAGFAAHRRRKRAGQ